MILNTENDQKTLGKKKRKKRSFRLESLSAILVAAIMVMTNIIVIGEAVLSTINNTVTSSYYYN